MRRRAERYRPWLYRVAAQALEDPEAALDCVQETLYHACESLPRFRQRSTLQTWLRGILTNVLAEEQRRRAREERLRFLLAQEQVPDVTSLTASRADLSDALYALVRLPLTLRSTAILGLLEGRGPKEVSGLLGLTIGAVRMRLSRARGLMKELPPTSAEARTVSARLADGYQALADLLLEQGREEECEQAWLRALRLRPDRAWNVFRWQYFRSGTPFWAASRSVAWRVAEETVGWPEAPSARLALASLQARAGNPAEAERLNRSLLSRRDWIAETAHCHLGLLYAGLGRPRQALPHVAASLELGRGMLCAETLAAKCLAQSGHPEARVWAERARTKAETYRAGPRDSVSRHIHRGNLLLFTADAFDALGEVAVARGLLEEARQAYPVAFRAQDEGFRRLESRLLRPVC